LLGSNCELGDGWGINVSFALKYTRPVFCYIEAPAKQLFR